MVGSTSAQDSNWMRSLPQCIECYYWPNAAGLAASADGLKLVAAGSRFSSLSGDAFLDALPMFLSGDSGLSWRQAAAPTNLWSAVASSADGTRLVAAARPSDANLGASGGDGLIYVSADSGATWMQTRAPTNTWSSVASSADGTRLVAAAYSDDSIYTSPDAGLTWVPTGAFTNGWSSVASSADGTKLAVAGGGGIYLSTNSGTTWFPTSLPESNSWRFVTCSADGAKLATLGQDEHFNRVVCVSTNAGTVWFRVNPNGMSPQWFSCSTIAWSADGAELLVLDSGVLSTSADAGSTWIQTAAPTNGWQSLACSGDAGKLVAAGGSGFFTWPYSGPWKPTHAPHENWTAVAASAGATKLIAASRSGIYASTDAGGTWRKTSAPGSDWSLASSVDGTELLAGGQSGIYSSADWGETWTQASLPTNYLWQVACSANGDRLLATHGSGQIYVSTNSGATWTAASTPRDYEFSANGATLVACAFGSMYLSTNSGATWTQKTADLDFFPSLNWPPWSSILACSDDGSRIIALAWWRENSDMPTDEALCSSTNSGATWTQTRMDFGSSVFVSPQNLSNLAATDSNGIFVSVDRGATWNSDDAPVGPWAALAVSAEGNHVVAATQEGAIYTLQLPVPQPGPPPLPRLSIDLAGNTIGLSWVLPSTRAVLQQSSGLTSTNWVDVITVPSLNLAKLRYEVRLLSSSGQVYYRLKQR